MARKSDIKREVARNLYVSGYPLDEVAAKTGVTRATIYRWIKVDRRKGLDWDRMRLERQIGEDEFRNKHRTFLFALFQAFEDDLPRLREMKDPDQRLELLDRYSNSYYKLMNAAKREAPEVAVAEVVSKALEKVAKLAAEDGRDEILAWLLDRIEPIKAEIIQEFQRQ